MLVLVGLLGGATQCSGSGDACTLIGCVSEVTTMMSVAVGLEETEGATVTICHNGACESGTMHLIGAEGLVSRCDFEDDVRFSCDAQRVSGSEIRLNAAFTLGEEDEATDGDEYSFAYHPAGDPGEPLAQEKGAVTFARVRPNGDGCEPTCATAHLPPP